MQHSPSLPRVIAIFNANDDVLELLRIYFEDHGFLVVSGHVSSIRRGEFDLVAFMRQHDPNVIVYDVVPPYDRSWRLLEHLRQHEPLKGRPFVLTTTNVRRLRELTSSTEEVHEIVGKPYDLDNLLKAVRRAASAKGTRSPKRP